MSSVFTQQTGKNDLFKCMCRADERNGANMYFLAEI